LPNSHFSSSIENIDIDEGGDAAFDFKGGTNL